MSRISLGSDTELVEVEYLGLIQVDLENGRSREVVVVAKILGLSPSIFGSGSGVVGRRSRREVHYNVPFSRYEALSAFPRSTFGKIVTH